MSKIICVKDKEKSNVNNMKMWQSFSAICIMHIRMSSNNKKNAIPKSRHIARRKTHIIRYEGMVSDGLGSTRNLDFGKAVEKWGLGKFFFHIL